MWKKARMPKTSPIRSTVSIEHRLVTNTDRHTATAIVPALAQRRAVITAFVPYHVYDVILIQSGTKGLK